MAKKLPAGLSNVSRDERKNWGFWDGRAAAKRHRWPEWARVGVDFAKAHFDSAYGEGFHAGWYGQPHPVTGEVPDA